MLNILIVYQKVKGKIANERYMSFENHCSLLYYEKTVFYTG